MFPPVYSAPTSGRHAKSMKLLSRGMYSSECETSKEGTMVRLQAFQVAAREAGFVEVSESAAGSILWLKKGSPDRPGGTFQGICIDSLTYSVTVYWMIALGKLDSKTFRGVLALQEWVN